MSVDMWEAVGGKEKEAWPDPTSGEETRKAWEGGAGAWEACLLRS